MNLRFSILDAFYYRREAVGVVIQVMMGILIFVIALSFVATVRSNNDDLLFGTVGGHWLIQPQTKQDVLSANSATLDSLKQSSDVSTVRARVRTTLSLTNPNQDNMRPESVSVTAVGIDVEHEPDLVNNFGIDAEDLEENTVVLTSHVAEQLGVQKGDQVTFSGSTGMIVLTVSAISEPQLPSFILDSWVVMDRSFLARCIYNDEARVSEILVDGLEGSDARQTLTALVNSLDSSAKLLSWHEASWASLGLSATIWTVLLLSVSTVVFLFICLGLTSLVYAALLSRVGDIAMIKAAGASSTKTTIFYFIQIMIQYTVGYLLGVCVSLIVMTIVNISEISSSNSAFMFALGGHDLRLTFVWWVFLIPFGLGMVVSCIVLWRPVHKVCSYPLLDLLEMR
jgi:hypothetical protein